MENFLKIDDFEETASKVLSPEARNYYGQGTGTGETLKLNVEAFKRYRIIPRVLTDVSCRNISTTILGKHISMPLGIAPTGRQKWAHSDGECASARAAEAANTVFILSAYSNSTIQEVAKAAPIAIKWLQLSISKDRNLTTYIVREAEKAGFKAVVVTVDNAIMTMSKKRNSANAMEQEPFKVALFKDYFPTTMPEADVLQYVKEKIDDSLTWKDIEWLKSITYLPIVVKGILAPADAKLAAAHGASAIIVSNHGGRQIDGVPATIEALPEIAEAAGHLVEIYLDGGVRKGIDVFRALALGARMVFVGRPIIWGLACGGQEGVRQVLELMRGEIVETFALTGCKDMLYLKSQKNLVVHESYFSNQHFNKRNPK